MFIRARKVAPALAMLVAASLALTACGPKAGKDGANPGTGTTTGAKQPAVGGELSLRLSKDPDSLNPILSSSSYGSMVYSQVYATLFEFNEKFEPTPYVAEKWEASADGLTWTIKIKEGIKFHDGAELTAEDVVYTLMSIKDKDYTGPRASSMKSVKAVTAPDKYTVKIELNQPYAPLFTNINYGILQKKLFESTSVADMATNPASMKPIGAGPYKFVDYKRGQYVLLERNPDWFMSKERNGAPFIQTLRYKVIPDDTTAVSALENGEIDLSTPDPKEVTRLEKDYQGKLVPINYERNGYGYIQFNVTRPGLDDKLVRQALTYGLDRQSIIDGVMDGRAVIPVGPISNVSWAYDPTVKPLPYDPAKAKQLLEQAGYKLNGNGIYEKNGQPLKFTFYASSGSSLIEGLTAIARKNWKDIGVDVDVQLLDFNAINDNYLKPGKFDIYFGGFSLGLDPDQTSLWHSSSVNGFNRGRFANKEIDTLLEQGVKEIDQAKRKQIYADFQRKLVDEAPAIYVYANKYTDFYSAKVKGGVVNYPGAGASFIYRWWINEQ